MTTRLKLFFLSFCIVLTPMLFSCASAVQQHKEDAVPPAAAAPEAVAPESAPTATAPEVETAPAAIETEVMEPAPAPEELHPYIIKKGDTLWDISNTFLKDPFLWPFIWKANPTITNPDLIFTGNTLMIPSLSPIERALLAAKEPVVEMKEEAAAVKEPAPLREAGIAGAHVTSPKQRQAEAEETPAGSRLILPEEQIYPIIDRFSMLSAGFVNEEETGDIITGAREKGKSIFGYDDVVYVSMRDAGNVKIGEKFLIFTHLHNVRHPKTRKNFGKLIKGLGILQITAKDPAADVLTARITLSFDAIEKGNMLTPYQEPVPIYNSSQKKAKDISGYILEVTDRRSINAQTDVVYIDRGKADGVEAGDRFVVYEEPVKRGFPRKVIGEVQVMLVKEHTSTAVVGKSAEPMGKGSPVNFKQ